ncbi:MAG: lamin tail domain-containing protein [Candidatus Omnitrophica bacterium]|nr:lamin tail domain-containing protein [Candidatus Omnitrophota bacterium]
MKRIAGLHVVSILIGLLTQTANQAYGAVILNEVLADNATLRDQSGNASDWIELYNTGTADVSLAGMSLTDDPANPHRWQFPEGAVIHPQDYWIIYCDGGLSASPWNTGFGLNAGGDAVYMFDQATNLVDSVVFGMQLPDLSIGRLEVAGGAWALMKPSLSAANIPVVMGNVWGLKINEWMASNSSGGDWFELFNPDSNPAALGGLYLSNSLRKDPYKYRIPDLSFIGTGSTAFQQFTADDSAASGANHVSFKLDVAGDEIGLFAGTGQAIDYVTFGPQTTDVSEGLLPDGSANVVAFVATASPGKSNFLLLSNAVINEILSHTDPPQEDAIELYNPSSADADIGGWYLSDSPSNFKKFRIPSGTTLPSHGYVVFYEHQLTNSAVPFTFNSSDGDGAYLSAANAADVLTGYRAEAKFGPAANGVSFGRYTNSVGKVDYVAQTIVTLNAANSGPLVGPIVINEIMYHPPSPPGDTNNNTLDEYLELYNISSQVVPLYDPLEPTNTWRIQGGISYRFPTGTSIPPGGYILLVNFNPQTDLVTRADFIAKLGLISNLLVLGPYSKNLGNTGDKVELQKPDPVQGQGHINQGFVPYIEVDKIEYSNTAPWPNADGTGQSLQRKDAFAYGDDPANWFAGSPSAMHRNHGGVIDHDADGLPDDWELAYGLDPTDPTDSTRDLDADGKTNLQEYWAGTNPLDPHSSFSVAMTWTANGLSLSFTAAADRSYSVQYRDSMETDGWLPMADISSAPTNHAVEVMDNQAGQKSQRYYRIAVPSTPLP